MDSKPLVIGRQPVPKEESEDAGSALVEEPEPEAQPPDLTRESVSLPSLPQTHVSTDCCFRRLGSG